MDNKTLIDNIAKNTGYERDEVQRLIADLCVIISERCLDMDAIVIPGFGQFEAKKRKERLTIHPSTGARLMVPPKLVLNFKPSGVLKSKVESGEKDMEHEF